jgi:anti-repressor protein
MKLDVYKNPEFGSIRTALVDEQIYFVGKDVAESLGYSNTKDALLNHVDKEDKTILQRSENTTFDIPNRGLTIINESGLYSLILSSKMPKAKEFKHWVTSEVLPSIRKHGLYATDELLNDPDLAIAAFTALKKEREKAKALEETIAIQNQQIVEMKPKASYYDLVF